MSESEGVVRFRPFHTPADLDASEVGSAARRIDSWRAVFRRLGLVGRDPSRYGGAGFGNLSLRLDPARFLITGSQTGGKAGLDLGDFCVVESVDVPGNRVTSRGPVPPSSESMTHAAVYTGWPAATAVVHAHAKTVWNAGGRLGLPVTSPRAGYGTTDLAREVERLAADPGARRLGLLLLGGHADGVIGFAPDLDGAALAVLRWTARAGEDPAGRGPDSGTAGRRLSTP